MNKQSTIPPQAELRDFLASLSQQHYNGCYLPGRPLYDAHRPAHWRTGNALCHAHKLPTDRIGWRTLTKALGLQQPVAERGVTYDPQVREHNEDKALIESTALDWPLQQLGEERRRLDEGIECIPRQRKIRAWSFRQHKYVVVGYCTTYEVR